jgi:cysteine desulfurase / selenocysteine lyase
MSTTRREFLAHTPAAAFLARPFGTKGPAQEKAAEPARASAWRSDFPALAQSINGKPLTYLDSAATTQRPRAVITAIIEFYERDNANPSRALHSLARRAAEKYEGARATVARFINATDPSEVVFVRGTTEGINLAAAAWGSVNLRSGDELVLTRGEHYSNLLPWRLAAERAGAIVRYAEVDDEGRIELEDLERKLTSRTRLVAFSHVSNVIGYINPAAQICARARAAGARVLIDAAQSVPHFAVDVQALGCDFLAFSSHKMLGPMGIGALWARRELLEGMAPYQSGSNMAHDVELELPIPYEHAALKFGAGTPNVSGPVGLAAAIDYLNRIGRDAVRNHEQSLTEYASRRLGDVRGLRILGPRTAADRIPVFAFTLEGRTPAEIVKDLDTAGVAVRAGDLASLPLLKRLGVTAAARASCYLYTDFGDIDRLADILHQTQRTKL